MKYGHCINKNCKNLHKLRKIGTDINDCMFTIPHRVICSECEYEILMISKEFIKEKMVIVYGKK